MEPPTTIVQPDQAGIPALWDRRRKTMVGHSASFSALLPAIGDFAWLLPVIFLFGRMNGAPGLLGDGDSGWHIRTGEWIIAHHHVPRQDIFSFTRPGQPWYAWEWLSDVIMAALHNAGGMQAVLLGSILLLCATFFLLYRLVLRKSGSAFIAFALTTLAAGGSAIHWLARPHLFTMLFLVAYCSLLDYVGEDERRTRLLLFLPAASVVWTNLHGGFFAGILVTGAWAGGEAFTALMAQDRAIRVAAIRRFRPYAFTTLGCFAASFINPYTWHLHEHLAGYVSNPACTQTIAEFTSLNFRHPLAPFFELMLMLGFATLFWSLLRRRFGAALLLAGWAHLALMSVRHIPLFMIVAAPQIGLSCAEWLGHLRHQTTGRPVQRLFHAVDSFSERINRADAGPHLYLAGPLCLFLLAAAMYGHSPAPRLRAEYMPANFPVAAMSALGDTDRIFTSDTWGGYLIYRRYPARVFVDGRSDFFGPEFEKEYADIMAVHFNWENLLGRHGVDTILLAVDAPLAGALKESGNWRPVYDDGIAIVFRPNASSRSVVTRLH